MFCCASKKHIAVAGALKTGPQNLNWELKLPSLWPSLRFLSRDSTAVEFFSKEGNFWDVKEVN